MANSSYLYRPTWAEVDLSAIQCNFRQIKKFFPAVRVIAVVKADAYGHGMREVARLLDQEEVDAFGVSNIHEGILLREQKIKRPILIFQSTLPPCERMIVKYGLTPTICQIDFAKTLNAYARTKKRQIPIHIKVDTGMGRLGVWYGQAVDFIKEVSHLEYLHTQAIYTHFPSADCDRDFTQNQIREFSQLRKRLEKEGLPIPYVHVANSMGIMGYQTQLDFVRPGIILYGLSPKPGARFKMKLKPALTVKSMVVFLKRIAKGRSVSYGRTFIADKDLLIATIPVGYNDGYWRCLSNKAFVLVGGRRCPVVGRVTMDQLMIDVTNVKNVRLGTEVVLLGRQGKQEISADELAALANTINYEIVCCLGNRLPRVYKV